MADGNLTLGRYAIISIDLQYIHPEYIRDKYPNAERQVILPKNIARQNTRMQDGLG